MKFISDVKERARQMAVNNGHELFPFKTSLKKKKTIKALCKKCGKSVEICLDDFGFTNFVNAADQMVVGTAVKEKCEAK